MTSLRDGLQLIYDWIPEDDHVLGLGYGDGEPLIALVAHKNCVGYDIEIDTDSVVAAMTHGVSVIQINLEEGLTTFDDQSFNMIVLSQIIRTMRNMEKILRCLVRVAEQAIINFPNPGYRCNHFQIAIDGHMPASEQTPYHWYDVPNIHWCTLKDFDLLCAKNKIRVLERMVMTGNRQVKHLPNLLGSLAFYCVG